MPESDPITAMLESAAATGVFPGAVLLVRFHGGIVYHRAVGDAAVSPERIPASVETQYDLASLTKPLATTSSLLCLMQDGRLALDTPVSHYLPELAGVPLGEVTAFHFLNHSSGLPAWRPFYEQLVRTQEGVLVVPSPKEARVRLLGLLGQEPLIYSTGSRSTYSDPGFMLLGLLVERVGGYPLDVFCQARLYDPLHASPLQFVPTHGQAIGQGLDEWQVAATEDDRWRGHVLRGEVHDENAFALGGVAGHSGLFGTAAAVSAVSSAWRDACQGRAGLFDSALVRSFVSRQQRTPGSSWGLGWDTPSPPSSSGTRLSSRAFGHLGFTGTSLWIDPVCELEVILLTNRVHPTRRNDAIRQFRPRLHDLVYEEVVEKGLRTE